MLSCPALVIEDEAVIAWMLEDVLETIGFEEVLLAANADQACELALTRGPGIVISDINLGARSADGVAAVTKIVSEGHIPVLFITGNASADALERIARGIPNARVMRKPVTPEQLSHAIVALAEADAGQH